MGAREQGGVGGGKGDISRGDWSAKRNKRDVGAEAQSMRQAKQRRSPLRLCLRLLHVVLLGVCCD